MQEKCPVMLTCRFGVVIVDDEFTWGHVRQTVLLQGKVPGDCCGRSRGRLLLTSRSFRFLARLKAFSGGLVKIFLVVPSSRRIWKFLEMIFSATRLLGWNVVTNGTLSFVMLLAASLFKISALDMVDARSLPLLMRSFGYPRAAKKVSIMTKWWRSPRTAILSWQERNPWTTHTYSPTYGRTGIDT